MNSSTRIFHCAPVKAARVPGAFAAVSLTHKNPWPLPAGNQGSSQAGATSSPNSHREREQGESNDHRQGRTDRMAPDFKVCISRSKTRSWFEGGPPFSRLSFRARSSKDRGSLHLRRCRLHGRFPGQSIRQRRTIAVIVLPRKNISSTQVCHARRSAIAGRVQT